MVKARKLNTNNLIFYTMKKVFMAIAMIAASMAIWLTSCNVTRVVSTQSSYVQHGDTTTQIVTKTVESYDAKKR